MEDEARDDQTLAIVGGRVFDGERFVERDLFVRGGVFVPALAEKPDRTIDAAGLYLLPPLAEAHTHALFGGAQSNAASSAYLKAGVFYALCANNPTSVSQEWRAAADAPGSKDRGANDGGVATAPAAAGARVDVIFANGGLTAPGGHPVALYRTLHTRMARQPEETFLALHQDSAFYEVENAQQLAEKWPKLMASEPDIVKLYLLGHNVGGQQFDLPGGAGGHYIGLSAEVFREAVRRAHEAGKRCIVHIETADEFALAVEAGADAVAHLPYLMTVDAPGKAIGLETAELAKERGTAAIASANLGLAIVNGSRDEESKRQMRQVWECNLRTLKEAGVAILLGSDGFSPMIEAAALRESGVFTDFELLRLWTRDTPRWMFPDRRLGALDVEHEASLIGLRGDPLANWSNVQGVALAVKQGNVLAAP